MKRAEKSTVEQSGDLRGSLQAAAGICFIVCGTMSFASKSILVKWAYEQGAAPEAVLLYRQLIAAPMFWGIFMIYRSKPKPKHKDVIKACTAGLLCFFLSPLFDFIGLHYVSAIVERMLVMSYPIFVLILSALLNRKRMPIRHLGAVFLVGGGLFLAVGGWDLHAVKANMTGAVLIILSAIFYAVYLVVSGRLVHEIGSIRMNAYGLSAASLAIAVYTAIQAAGEQPVNLFSYDAQMYGLFIIIAVATTVVPFIFMLEGIKRIGAERGALISIAGPVITIFLGVLFLNERLSPVQWLGCFLVLFVISLLEYRKRKR
ncbi:DMT family transporter [Bacillus sonorensis]|uniref:DMT family transporter n=1 Tax=Bacillus sonorensis TaxID=119858 RepID=UPI002DB8C1AC|nr:DMT family transporter [Bacillus sonorensis]MEC1355219.1 DMT family transporter [Bacillus sonorensis]MEC1424680.1 DMT family transporter [Bacillus sonorensis]